MDDIFERMALGQAARSVPDPGRRDFAECEMWRQHRDMRLGGKVAAFAIALEARGDESGQ
eukprot:gene41699-biopygen28245